MIYTKIFEIHQNLNEFTRRFSGTLHTIDRLCLSGMSSICSPAICGCRFPCRLSHRHRSRPLLSRRSLHRSLRNRSSLSLYSPSLFTISSGNRPCLLLTHCSSQKRLSVVYPPRTARWTGGYDIAPSLFRGPHVSAAIVVVFVVSSVCTLSVLADTSRIQCSKRFST